jgi:hypothetical protein
MDRRLAEAGCVVVQAVPRLSRVDPAAGSSYLAVFAQERTPLEKLFAGEKRFLTPDPLEGERQMPFAVGAALDSPEAARALYNAFPRPLVLEGVERTDDAPGPGLRADFAGGSRLGFAWRFTGDGQRTFVQTSLKRGRTVASILGALMSAGGFTGAAGVAGPDAASQPADIKAPRIDATVRPRFNEVCTKVRWPSPVKRQANPKREPPAKSALRPGPGASSVRSTPSKTRGRGNALYRARAASGESRAAPTAKGICRSPSNGSGVRNRFSPANSFSRGVRSWANTAR